MKRPHRTGELIALPQSEALNRAVQFLLALFRPQPLACGCGVASGGLDLCRLKTAAGGCTRRPLVVEKKSTKPDSSLSFLQAATQQAAAAAQRRRPRDLILDIFFVFAATRAPAGCMLSHPLDSCCEHHFILGFLTIFSSFLTLPTAAPAACARSYVVLLLASAYAWWMDPWPQRRIRCALFLGGRGGRLDSPASELVPIAIAPQLHPSLRVSTNVGGGSLWLRHGQGAAWRYPQHGEILPLNAPVIEQQTRLTHFTDWKKRFFFLPLPLAWWDKCSCRAVSVGDG